MHTMKGVHALLLLICLMAYHILFTDCSIRVVNFNKINFDCPIRVYLSAFSGIITTVDKQNIHCFSHPVIHM